MVTIKEAEKFKKSVMNLDNHYNSIIKNQIRKIAENPEAGKPMRNFRKGTRELYIKPFRLSYAYLEHENKIILLDLYHKKKQ
jgi:mRNA-degrading endonuclease RelE of RelBE toxin-antitoxin system